MRNFILILCGVFILTGCSTIKDFVSGDSCLDRVITGKELATEAAVQANLSHAANFISDEDREDVFSYTDKAMTALDEAKGWCIRDEITANDYLNLAFTFIRETDALLERKY